MLRVLLPYFTTLIAEVL